MLVSGFSPLQQVKKQAVRFGGEASPTPTGGNTPAAQAPAAPTATPPLPAAPISVAPPNVKPVAPVKVIEPKDVRLDRDSIGAIKNMGRMSLPAIDGSWPLALMGLLIEKPDVEKYVLQTANVTRASISSGIDTQALPKLVGDKEGTLKADYYENVMRPSIREFTAKQGQTLTTPVLLWRWLMQADPNGKLDGLLQIMGLDKANVQKLRNAPSIEQPVAAARKRRTKEEIISFREALAELPKRVIGQEGPVQELIDGMRVARAGHAIEGEEELPKTRFLLLGPSGVGKTYSCEELAKILKRPVIYVTMTEYMNEMDAKKFTGAAPGYTGYGDPTFVDKVRKAVDESEKNGTPPPVIILDEIEKAHPIVIKTILQMLGKGRLEDSQQNVAIFKDCDILMTSNVAQKEIAAGQANISTVQKAIEEEKAGQADAARIKELEGLLAEAEAAIPDIVENSLKQAFPYEFLGRINKKIIFQSLSRDDAGKILDMQVKKLAKSVKKDDNYTLEITQPARENILDGFYSLDTGARKLKDGIQSLIHEPLLVQEEDVILGDGQLDGGKMIVDFADKKPKIRFEPSSTTSAPTTAA